METSPITRGQIALLIIIGMILLTGIKTNAFELREQPMIKLDRQLQTRKKHISQSRLARQKHLEYVNRHVFELKEQQRQQEIKKQQRIQITSQSIAYSMSDEECKAYIIAHESPTGRNSSSGKYIGYFQIDYRWFDGRLGGDGTYSVENQYVVAENYMMAVYGTWQKACAKKMAVGKW